MARAGNNSGSIYKTAEGQWEAAVTMSRGKRRRLRRQSYAEALAARNQLLAERDQQIQTDRRLTVGQLLDEWLDDLKIRVRRPRTWQAYDGVVRLYIRPQLGHVRAALLTPSQYRSFQNGLLAQLAPSTVAKVRAALHAAYVWALSEERLPRNPVGVIRPPRAVPYAASPFTIEQAIAALVAVREHEHGPFWAFLLSTGARFGEAAAIRESDLDLDTRAVWLRQAKASVPKAFRSAGSPTWEIAEMKSRSSVRSVPLTRFAVAALRRQAEIREELRRCAGRRWSEYGLVFPSSVGTPLRDDHVGRRWKDAMRQAGLPPIRLHDLRHTIGVSLRRSGTDLKTISELLGHANVGITAAIYLQGAVPDLHREAVDRYDRLLHPLLPGADAAGSDQEWTG